MNSLKKVIVLGGGISGLSAHYYALERSLESVLVERSGRLGGWIDEHRDAFGNLHSCGPRSLRTASPAESTLALLRRLGLDGSLVWASPEASRRMLLVDGRLRPLTPLSFLRPPFSAMLPGILREPFVPSKKYTPRMSNVGEHDGDESENEEEDESVAAFFTRRFGRDFAETVAAAVVQGIYAADPARISLKSCFPFLHDAERQRGSVLRAMLFPSKPSSERKSDKKEKYPSPLFTLRGGLSQLVDGLAGAVPPSSLRLSCAPLRVELRPSETGGVSVQLADGAWLHADHLLSAIPPPQLLSLCPTLFHLDQQLHSSSSSSSNRNSNSNSNSNMDSHSAPSASSLSAMRYTSLAVVNFAFSPSPASPLPPSLRGFGYLVPPRERQPVLGVILDSCAFPQLQQDPSLLRLTVMLGGDPRANPAALDVAADPALSDARLVDLALSHLRLRLPCVAQARLLHARAARCVDAIPAYDVGHARRIRRFEQALRTRRLPLSLLGGHWGVGVNNCIQRSLQVVSQLSMENQLEN